MSAFEKLFPEIHLEIFKYLDPVESTCLGLACKEFYPIHRQLHGTVSLQTKTTRNNCLFSFLRDWHGNKMVYDAGVTYKFQNVAFVLNRMADERRPHDESCEDCNRRWGYYVEGDPYDIEGDEE